MEHVNESAVLFYDNYCPLCYRIAKIVWILSRKRIKIIGMYSDDAKYIRELIDLEEYQLMPWLIYRGKIYGGRKIIFPILKEILKGILKPGNHSFDDEYPTTCSAILPCKGLSGFIYRTWSLLSKSKIIEAEELKHKQ